MFKQISRSVLRKRRTSTIVAAVIALLVFQIIGSISSRSGIPPAPQQDQDQNQGQSLQDVLSETDGSSQLALDVLEQLAVKGRASKTGYSRDNFSDGWARVSGCDVRNLILDRDLTDVEYGTDGCTILVGVLIGPYTDNEIIFVRGQDTSDAVQIDHVVAVSDAWQKGAQQLSADERFQFYNDSLNLLATDGDANQAKGSSDAASWLPPHKPYRCRFVARQIAVKQKYRLWVTNAEKSAMKRVLGGCEDQPLQVEE